MSGLFLILQSPVVVLERREITEQAVLDRGNRVHERPIRVGGGGSGAGYRLTTGLGRVVEPEHADSDVLTRHRTPEPRFVPLDGTADLRTHVADVLDRITATGTLGAHVIGDVDGLTVTPLAETFVTRIVEPAIAGEVVATAPGNEVHLHTGALLRRVGAGRRDLNLLERVEVVVVLGAWPAAAQVSTGEIFGKATDTTGAGKRHVSTGCRLIQPFGWGRRLPAGTEVGPTARP